MTGNGGPRSRRRPRAGLALATAAAALAWALGAAPRVATAQEPDGGTIPRPAAGTPALVLPLQDAVPLPSGGWPGGARSRAELLDRFGAELEFALGERTGGPDWAGPGELRDLVRRNPMLRGDPDRLAAGGLPPAGEDLPGALHGQLRDLSAATGARYALLPLRLAYRRTGPPRAACPPVGAAGPASGDTARARGEPGLAGPGRTVLCVALLDVRAARVLWRGAILAPPGPPDDPAAPAALAQRLLDTFSGGG